MGVARPALWNALASVGCLGLLILASAGLPPAAVALEVILMRHADKDLERGDYNLSPAGFVRAMHLARLIPACFGPPTGITTYLLDPRTSKNARSYQSAVPLAVATGVPISIALDAADQSEQIGRRIRSHQGDGSQRLVLFWEHRHIPQLARGLGVGGLAPIAADDFDQLYLIRYPHASGAPMLLRYRQSDLFHWPCYQQSRLPWEAPGSLPSSNPQP